MNVDEQMSMSTTQGDGFFNPNATTRSPCRSQKKHWSISPFNTITDFGTGKILVKKTQVGGGAPQSITKDIQTNKIIDTHALTTRI